MSDLPRPAARIFESGVDFISEEAYRLWCAQAADARDLQALFTASEVLSLIEDIAEQSHYGREAAESPRMIVDRFRAAYCKPEKP